ncbi:hypothetical protein T484DRAFT_1921355, partial [Baffinella frigidus]
SPDADIPAVGLAGDTARQSPRTVGFGGHAGAREAGGDVHLARESSGGEIRLARGRAGSRRRRLAGILGGGVRQGQERPRHGHPQEEEQPAPACRHGHPQEEGASTHARRVRGHPRQQVGDRDGAADCADCLPGAGGWRRVGDPDGAASPRDPRARDRDGQARERPRDRSRGRRSQLSEVTAL